MELFLYIFLLIISAYFMIKQRTINSNKLFFIFYFVTFAAMSATVRLNLDHDFVSYKGALVYKSYSFYIMREPIVWLGIRYMFSVLQSAYWTFVLFDLLIGLILYKALARFKVPQYAYFSILTFFPFLMGFNNAYRQWVASIFLLYAFSLIRDRNRWGWAWFIFSGLAHNVAGVFVGLLFLGQKGYLQKSGLIVAILITPILIYFGGYMKSRVATGADLAVAYIVLLLVFLIFYAVSDKLKVKFLEIDSYKAIFLLVYITVFAVLFLSSAGAERTALVALICIYPLLTLKIESRYRQKYFLRLTFALLGFIPLLFSAANILVL
jgi:hypothetical protein